MAGTSGTDNDDTELLLLNQSTGALISTVSTVSDGNGILLVPSKSGADLYYEGLDSGDDFSSIYDFKIASQTFTSLYGSFGIQAGIVLSPDGTTLYTVGDFYVQAINTTTFAITEIPSPVPAVGIAITPDGSDLVVTSTESELGVIPVANPLLGVTIPIGGATNGISVR